MRKMSERDLNVNKTMLAVRERLMSYYKGSCVDSIVQSSPVEIVSLRSPGGYYYQRLDHENRNPSCLVLGGKAIAEMALAPDEVVLYKSRKGTMLAELHAMMEQFFKDYLPYVNVERKDEMVGIRKEHFTRVRLKGDDSSEDNYPNMTMNPMADYIQYIRDNEVVIFPQSRQPMRRRITPVVPEFERGISNFTDELPF